MPQIRFASFNAAGKGGTLEGLSTVVHCINSACGERDVMFISELDFLVTCDFEFVDDYRIFRHYPPVGGRAMGFLIKRHLECFVRHIVFRGRAGLLQLSSLRAADGFCAACAIIGIHGAHGENLEDSLSDAAYVASYTDRSCRRVFAGDWNVDVLPELTSDPF